MSEKNKSSSLECQLFTWESWEQFDTVEFVFLDVTLLKDLGPFKAGEKFSSATVDYEHSRLDLQKEPEALRQGFKFSLSLHVTYDGPVNY